MVELGSRFLLLKAKSVSHRGPLTWTDAVSTLYL